MHKQQYTLMLMNLVFTVNLSFFFSSRRRHTRFDCDWSSDVCSSDLTAARSFSSCCAAAFAFASSRSVSMVKWRVAEIGRGAGGGRGEISGVAGSLKKKKNKDKLNKHRSGEVQQV